jgi:hypothetical protein
MNYTSLGLITNFFGWFTKVGHWHNLTMEDNLTMEESQVIDFINDRKWTCSDKMITDLKIFYLDKFNKSISLQRRSESGCQAYTGKSMVMHCTTSINECGGTVGDPLCKLRIPLSRLSGIWKLARNKKKTCLLHCEQCMGHALLDSKFDKNVVSTVIARDGGNVTTLNSAGVSPELRRKRIDLKYTGTST